MVHWLFDQVTWDGQALRVTESKELRQVVCKVPRNTIHRLRRYSDAIDREIHLERQRITEKLAQYLAAKLSQVTSVEAVELFP